MKELNHPKLIAFSIFGILAIIFVIATFTLAGDSEGGIPTTEASQPTTEITFDPSGYLSDEHGEESVEIYINPNIPNRDEMDYVNIKIQYDPSKLEVSEVSKGQFPGIYQNSILVDQEYEPVGLVSILWIPRPGGEKLVEKASLATLKLKTLSDSPQGMNITSLTDPTDWRSNIVQTKTKTFVPVTSEGLSINGGSTDFGDSISTDLYCSERCRIGEMCVSGNCEMLASVQNSNLSLVLGASTDGSIADIDLLKGDLNLDGEVDTADMSLLMSDILSCAEREICNPRADIDGDGDVSMSDYYLFTLEFEL